MPRFFFNVHDGHDIPDRDGCDLPSVRAAQAHAVRYAGHLLADLQEEFWNEGDWRMDVANDRGLILFSLLFIGIESAALSRS